MKYPTLAITLASLSFLANAVTLNVPSRTVRGASSEFTWTSDRTRDPAQMLIFLGRAGDFMSVYQSWYNVDTFAGRLPVLIDAQIPASPNDYQLTARNATNIDVVLSWSPVFKLQGPPPSPITSSSSTVRPTSTSSTPTSTTSTASTTTPTSQHPSSTTTTSLSTITPPATPPPVPVVTITSTPDFETPSGGTTTIPPDTFTATVPDLSSPTDTAGGALPTSGALPFATNSGGAWAVLGVALAAVWGL